MSRFGLEAFIDIKVLRVIDYVCFFMFISCICIIFSKECDILFRNKKLFFLKLVFVIKKKIKKMSFENINTLVYTLFSKIGTSVVIIIIIKVYVFTSFICYSSSLPNFVFLQNIFAHSFIHSFSFIFSLANDN